MFPWLKKLLKGQHKADTGEYCIMEAVAKAACEPHSDHPKTACPVLSPFMRTLNDSMNDAERQQLMSYISKLVGSNNGKTSEKLRYWLT